MRARLSTWSSLTALFALVTALALTLPAKIHPVLRAAVRPATGRGSTTYRLATLIHAMYANNIAKIKTAATPRVYTIKHGDTLSGIAAAHYGDAKWWPNIYNANRNQIRWADIIQVGQVITLPEVGGTPDAPPAQLEPAAAPVHTTAAHASSGGKVWGITYGDPNFCGDGDGDGWDVSCQAAPIQQAAAPQQQAPQGGTIAPFGSSFQQCVISHESGGNPRAVNASSGAGGLYQFLPSTWQSLGYSGLPENAPVWQQNQAFQRLYAQSGTSPWAPYDGC